MSHGRELTSYDGNTFAYDALGRRIGKNGITFTYDSNGNLIFAITTEKRIIRGSV